MITRACQTCRQPFLTQSGTQRFCSSACRQATYPERICGHCTVTFHTRREQQFCSNRCAGLASRKPTETRRCEPPCGKLFEVRRHKQQRFCSQRCANIAVGARRGRSAPQSAVPREQRTRVCEQCRQPFIGSTRTQRFCNQACSSLWAGQRLRERRRAREAVAV